MGIYRINISYKEMLHAVEIFNVCMPLTIK